MLTFSIYISLFVPRLTQAFYSCFFMEITTNNWITIDSFASNKKIFRSYIQAWICKNCLFHVEKKNKKKNGYDIYGKGNLQSFFKSSCDEQKLRRFKLNISIQEARGFFCLGTRNGQMDLLNKVCNCSIKFVISL